MSDGLSDSLLDFQLDITGGNRRNITQVAYDPLLPPSAPRRLENWQCSNRPIGSGGQGAIYLQRCTTSGSRLNDCRALKIIKCQDDEKRSRYIRELEVMARFSHEKVHTAATVPSLMLIVSVALQVLRQDVGVLFLNKQEGSLPRNGVLPPGGPSFLCRQERPAL